MVTTTEEKSAPAVNALPWLGLSAAMIALDQLTKWLAVQHLQFQQPVEFVPGFWNWTLTHNRGAAFSFLASAGGWQHWFFIVLAVLVSLAMVVALKGSRRDDWRNAAPFALIIAGALGNVIDRFRFGYVIDFVHWYWQDFHWPVFNVADSCIVLGATLMVLFSLRRQPRDKVA